MADSMSPVGEALHFLKLSGVFYCKSDLRGSWGIALPEMPDTSMFHIVTAGSCWVDVGDQACQLRAGDFAFVPKGQGHTLRSDGSTRVVDLFDLHRDQISHCYETLVLGDQGPITTVLCGVVKLDHPSADYLMEAMPNLIVLESARTSLASWMSHTVHLIALEAERMLVGGETILTRLADVMVIQALRYWIEHGTGANSGWLSALNDPRIGRAMALMHSHPERSWTLENLGREIGMSRTAFATAFRTMVGEPVLQYLTRWRMNLALMRIRDGERVTLSFIEQLGYRSEAAFRRTFKRIIGRNIGEIPVQVAEVT